jgi:hypothetical protein
MHGFSQPVVGRDRNSVALYYYTASPPDRFSGDGSTYWRSRSMESQGLANQAKRVAYRVCMALSYRMSVLGWCVRPE